MDVTELLFRLMLQNSFPYKSLDLNRRYDFLLAEELKFKLVSLSDGDVTVATHEFHLRRPDKDTKKFSFRIYDEMYLAPLSHFNPTLLDHQHKLQGRRSLWDRSYDIYDDMPNDPMSTAQSAIYQSLSTKVQEPAPEAPAPRPFGAHLAPIDTTPRSSVAGSPGPESQTPLPGAATPSGQGEAATANGSVAGGVSAAAGGLSPKEVAMRMWEDYDSVIPVCALDKAVIDSISHAAKGDEKKMRDFFAGIMVVGGGGAVAGFRDELEGRIKARLQREGREFQVLIGVPPRELDSKVICWKGASVFGKLRGTNDSWVRQREYDILGQRVLVQRCMWGF